MTLDLRCEIIGNMTPVLLQWLMVNAGMNPGAPNSPKVGSM